MADNTVKLPAARGFNISKLAVDPQKEKDGVWFDGPNGLRLRVARLSNPEYQEAIQKLGRPYMRQIRNNTIAAADLNRITVKALAKHILLDWENLLDENDEVVPYSVAKAEEYLRRYPEFVQMVEDYAQGLDAFQADAQEDAEGNSSAASSGSSDGQS